MAAFFLLPRIFRTRWCNGRAALRGRVLRNTPRHSRPSGATGAEARRFFLRNAALKRRSSTRSGVSHPRCGGCLPFGRPARSRRKLRLFLLRPDGASLSLVPILHLRLAQGEAGLVNHATDTAFFRFQNHAVQNCGGRLKVCRCLDLGAGNLELQPHQALLGLGGQGPAQRDLLASRA